MNSKLLVSVIVPVYNIKKYIERCLKSLLVQNYKNIEIIVVDDGATDGSGEICDRFAKLDNRVRVFHKKNGGLSSARNFGIKKARGEYICLVDGDDYVERDFVGAMLEIAEGKNADIVVCGYNGMVPADKTLSGKDAVIKLLVEQENLEIIAWNKLYRKKLFDEIEYPEGRNYEDTLTTYKLLARAKKVSYIPTSLYKYVERDGSITNSDKKEAKLNMREVAALEAIDYFSGNQELKKAAEVALLTAKIAFIDFSVSGAIRKEKGEQAMRWVRKNVKKYRNNRFMTLKLKTYLRMICMGGGALYILFRKIRHE